jgi:glycerol-3-phosphate acyltransferase PlsY
MTSTIILTLIGYLFGSVSSAIIVCRLLSLPDPRTEGSGNPGATNVLRVGGKKAGALTLAGDFLKGTLPLLITRAITDDPLTLALVGAAAFVGHLYPVFFGFKGGKGVATGFGVLLGWHWLAALLTVVTWLLMAKLVKISSLSALVAFLLAPVFVWLTTASLELTITMGLLTAITFWRHRGNIAKLLAGTEGRIGQKG